MDTILPIENYKKKKNKHYYIGDEMTAPAELERNPSEEGQNGGSMKKTISFALVSVLLLTGILGMVLPGKSAPEPPQKISPIPPGGGSGSGGPDLTILDGSIERHWNQIYHAWYLTAKAQNIGSEDVTSCFHIQWFVGGNSIGYSSLCYLDAGDTKTIRSPYFTASGTQNVQVHIDCFNEINETNENNNWASTTIWFSQ